MRQVAARPADQVRLTKLACDFFLMGLVTFGAGMFALIYQRIVHQKQWMSEEDFRAGITYAELAPGPFTLHVVMYIGYHLRGLAGLLLATLAFSLPSIILVVMIALAHRFFLQYVPGLEGFILGVWAAIFAMMLSTILTVGKEIFRSAPLSLVMIGAFAATYFLNVSFFVLIVACGLIVWSGSQVKRLRSPVTLSVSPAEREEG